MDIGSTERLASFTLICFSLVLGCSYVRPLDAEPTGLGRSAQRAVTVADAIEMTRPADELRNQPIAHYSPDGKKLVVLLRKGSLRANTNQFTLVFWKTDDILTSPPADQSLTLSSSSNRDAIESVSWLDDSETLVFLGEHPGELHQLYSFNIRTLRLRKLTNNSTNLVSFTVTPGRDQIAYTAESPPKSIFNAKAQHDGFVVSTQALDDLLEAKTSQASQGGEQLFFKSREGDHRLMHIDEQIPPPGDDVPSVSPDGRYILIPLRVAHVPDSWKAYLDPRIHELVTRKLSPGQYSWLTRYVLVDTKSSANRIFLNSPVNWNTQVAWSPDSRSAVFVNAYLPLDNVDGEERAERQSRTFTFEAKVSGGQIVRITQDELKSLRWDSKTKLLICKPAQVESMSEPTPEVLFRKVTDKWEKFEDTHTITMAQQPEIVEQEDMNTPPKLFAIDPKTERRVLLMDLNRGFAELDFAKVEEIEWKGTDGHKVKGGLYYPTHYTPGKKYPLVIQTHEWYADRFLIDGPYTTAFAAQPLAAKGIMVLQTEHFDDVDDWWSTLVDTPGEIDRYVSVYEGGIEYLDEKGLIDRDRVGIIGFSRTCLYVKYALTHSKYHFAAASVTDGIDAGYFQYLAFNTNSNIPREFEAFNDGPPFGQHLQSWMKRSPGFNLAELKTPLLIVALNPQSVLMEWEWFAALRRLGKPVEMVTIQDGAHELVRPWDRMVSLQGNVDWFAFWLKGEQAPDPAKAEMYARWRELKKMQQENDKKAKAAAVN